MTMPVHTEGILERIVQGERIQRTLPFGGRLHMDRPLPFLAVYRFPSKRLDQGLMRIVQAESAYLITPTGYSWKRWGANLVESLTTTLVERFGGVLLLEIWTTPQGEGSKHETTEHCCFSSDLVT